MAKETFFMSWELWQQMTFALAVAIVAVFCAGLVKLWWTNRIVRKQEILDEEKKARINDMRSTGLRPASSKRAAASTIPFGVRAIQSGVQVDGIWISRPATPTETKPTSAVTLVYLGAEQQRREKIKGAAGVTTTARSLVTPDGSLLQGLTDSESLESASSGAIPPPIPQDQRHDYPHRHGLRVPHALNEDTLLCLRRLEGQDGGAQSPQRPAVHDIYVPTRNSQRQQDARDGHIGGATRGDQRITDSKPGDSYSDSAHQRLPRSGSQRSYNSTSGGEGGERLYEPRGAKRRDAAVGDPFGTPSLQVIYQQHSRRIQSP